MGIIQRQGIKNTITNYIGIIIGFVNLMIIQPRFLTAEELGLTRLLYSFSLLVAMFIPMGIGNATMKYFPLFRNEEKKHHGYFGFMILFPFAGFVLAAGVLYFFRDVFISQYVKESKLFTEFFNYVFPLTFIISIITVLNIYCYSIFKSTVPSFINDVVVRILVISLVSVYYLKLISLDQFISFFVGIYALQILMILAYIRFEEIPGLKVEWKFFREQGIGKLLRYSSILWLAGVASQGLKELGTIVTGKFLSLDYVAVYAIAAFVPTIIEAPLGALERIANFKISDSWKQGRIEEVNLIYHKSVKYMMILGGLLFLGINLNIESLLTFLPEKYRAGNLVVNIISIGTLINMATGLNTAILFSSDKYHYGAGLLILLVIMSFVFQFLFIPLYGIEGAALATALSGILYNVISFFVVWKHFNLQPFNADTIKTFASILIVLGIVFFIPHFGTALTDIIAKSIIITLLYGCLIYFLKIIPEFHKYLRLKK